MAVILDDYSFIQSEIPTETEIKIKTKLKMKKKMRKKMNIHPFYRNKKKTKRTNHDHVLQSKPCFIGWNVGTLDSFFQQHPYLHCLLKYYLQNTPCIKLRYLHTNFFLGAIQTCVEIINMLNEFLDSSSSFCIMNYLIPHVVRDLYYHHLSVSQPFRLFPLPTVMNRKDFILNLCLDIEYD